LGKQPIPLNVFWIIRIKFPLVMLPTPSVDLIQVRSHVFFLGLSNAAGMI
jgi:hypothetical protein